MDPSIASTGLAGRRRNTVPCGAPLLSHANPPSAPPLLAEVRPEVLRAGFWGWKFGPSRDRACDAGTPAGGPGDLPGRRGSSGAGRGSRADSGHSPPAGTHHRSRRDPGRTPGRSRRTCRSTGKPASDAVSPRPRRPETTTSDPWTDAETDAILIPSNTSPRARHRGPGVSAPSPHLFRSTRPKGNPTPPPPPPESGRRNDQKCLCT